MFPRAHTILSNWRSIQYIFPLVKMTSDVAENVGLIRTRGGSLRARSPSFLWILAIAFSAIFVTILVVASQTPPEVPAQVRTSSESQSIPTVAILIQTSPDFFNTRVAQIRDTWGARVHAKKSMSLHFVVGDITDGNPDMIKSGCAQDYLSAVCRLGFALEKVREDAYWRRFDWFFFGDDDIYLIPDNLQRMIQTLGPDALRESKAWCLPGCEMNGCVGYCGGGGILMSQFLVSRIVEERDALAFPSLLKELESNEPTCGKFHDVSFGYFLEHNRTNIKMVEYPFFPFAFTFKDSIELFESLRNVNGLSWLYHYPSRGAMYWLDYMIKAMGTSKEIPEL